MLTEHMATLKALAEALLEKEVLDSPEIDEIIRQTAAQAVPA
jgi:cell division protease FtsH